MALTINDPGHVALRRGIRAAIALPVGLAIALFVADDPNGVLFTVFGIVGLLINADFAGSNRERVASYLLTGVAGTISLVVGWAASFSTPAAAITTVVVAFGLSFMGLLRGPIAVGTPAVLLVFVLAVSINSTAADLPGYVSGWWLAVVVSTVSALVLFPHNRRADQRAALATAFAAGARSAERAWADPDGPGAKEPAFTDYAAAVAKLDEQYGSQPFRTNGLTGRDQAMTLLVDHVNSARLLLAYPPEPPARVDVLPLDSRDGLVRAIIDALDDLAAAMRDPHRLPTGQGLDDARVLLTNDMESWVLGESRRGTDPATISATVSADHRLRMAALVVEQMVELARVVNGGQIESLERRPPIPIRSRSSVMLSQLHIDSPWLRNALRSAIGLGLAVLVVNITGVAHGFWVLIGVISILRFDAVGTRKFAAEAVVGTIVGVLVATVVVMAVGQHQWILWMLLPPTVFLAAWAAAAVGYPSGQAAFSALILVAMGIIEWPPDATVGLVRIEDIALGAGVALVVGLLMWPRGAVGYLRRELAIALRAGSDYMSTAIGCFSAPMEANRLDERRQRAVSAAERASETYDIALMQRGPVEDMRPWTSATTAAYLLISAGRVIAHFAATTPAAAAHPELTAAIEHAQRDSTAHWAAVARELDAGGIPAPIAPDAEHPLPVLPDVATRDDARSLIIAIWVVGWVAHLDRLSTGRAGGAGGLA